MEKRRRKEDVFLRLFHYINVLTNSSVFTEHDKDFIYNYVLDMHIFRNNLNKRLKLNIEEYAENYYKVVFWFPKDKYVFLQIPSTDPFYPLQRHSYKLLEEFQEIKEYYDLHGNTEKLRSLIKPTFFLITDQRKMFLEDMISLMCKSYSLRVKNTDIRANISNKIKRKIDYFFKKAIEKHHDTFFEPIRYFARATDSYVEMCKCLKIIKNPVDQG